MTDFLLELRSEEIPARMQDRARADLEKLFAAELAKSGLAATETVTYATPRRLALIARGLPDATEAVSEELKGPRTSAPPQALEGFLRKTGLTQDQLVERDGVWFAVLDRPGRATRDVLAEAIPAIVRAFPWPKSMRWGEASVSTESPRWVRPLHGIVAILGEELVPCEVAGIASGYATVGHRFHHPGEITIGSAADYVEKLRACHVIVDQEERKALIRDRAAALAAEAGLKRIEDEGLVSENAGLTEWPVPLLGGFDAAFLDVPPEVIQLTARVNQKYFVCRIPTRAPLGEGDHPARPDGGRAGEAGKLANAFICVANIDPKDGGARIVEGNRKVLAARLADARFFFETDLKTPLEEQAKKLQKIVFHEKLGTLADKVDRVAKLARWLVEEGIVGGTGPTSPPFVPSEVEGRAAGGAPGVSTSLDTNGQGPSRAELAALAERAARLAKADLVTGMVGEFPELQGLIGGYYARAQGEPPEVADAIRDHYKPVGQGDEVPTAPVTVAVSLADKLDTIVSFFAIGEKPTGSKDPFALRRAALSIIATILENGIRCNIDTLTSAAAIVIIPATAGSRVKDVIARDVQAFGRAGVLELLDERDYVKRVRSETESDDHIAVLRQDLYSVLPFLADRLKVQQREAGVRHDLIDAVFALGGEDDLVRLLARVKALQAFIGSEDGANLLTGYKRAANILRKEGWGDQPPQSSTVTPAKAGGHTPDGSDGTATAATMDSRLRGNDEGGEEGDEGAVPEDANGIPFTGEEDPLVEVDDPDFAPVVAEFARSEREKALSYTPEPEEDALMTALDSAEPRAAAAVEAEDFEGAMAALASLRAPIDAFFDHVTVNDPDPAKRAARLALLARMRDAVHRVADFSRIEG